TTFAAHADLWLVVHLDLGDDPARRGIQPGKVDAGSLADDTASSVAADEVLRVEPRVIRQLDIDTVAVLSKSDHLATANDRHSKLSDPSGEDAFEVALPQGKDVVVAGGEVADVQWDCREPLRRHRLSLGEEPIGDAALIQHLDRARQQTARSRS